MTVVAPPGVRQELQEMGRCAALVQPGSQGYFKRKYVRLRKIADEAKIMMR